VGKTIRRKTSLLPRSCPSFRHLALVGVSGSGLPATRYWERLTERGRESKERGERPAVVLVPRMHPVYNRRYGFTSSIPITAPLRPYRMFPYRAEYPSTENKAKASPQKNYCATRAFVVC
jgi:hypothetical protein